jgi:hypothetical protein
METKVYDISYWEKGIPEFGSLAIDRVDATVVYTNDFGQLIITDNLRQIEALSKDVWIRFEEVKTETDG